MECGSWVLMLLLTHLVLVTQSYSKSIITSLPGYPGQLPFKFETGYIGLGDKKEVQLFYYFVESERNPKEDPLLLYISGGPGASAILTFFYQFGPLSFNFDGSLDNITMTLKANSWTKMANVILVDMPAGTGFSYATTAEASVSSDTTLAKQTIEFLRKFLNDHPKFLENPLYIVGISYMGIVVPIVTLEIYNENERGDKPTLNIQGYILCSPLTDKFMDFNSRLEYAHRMTLISDHIYESAIVSCHGDYVNIDAASYLCAKSLQRYEECISGINLEQILEPLCETNDPKPYCREYYYIFATHWANDKAVQEALNVRQGTIGKWEMFNLTMHYSLGKEDVSFYSYDIFSSFSYHKELVSKKCRSLIYSGDHDMTFPYVGIEQWISSLDLRIESPWEPFYVNTQVGGYEMTYAQDNFSLTFATVKGAGHSVSPYKPKEIMTLLEKWFARKTYSSPI